MRAEAGKQTPKKDMNNIFMTSHMTLSRASQIYSRVFFVVYHSPFRASPTNVVPQDAKGTAPNQLNKDFRSPNKSQVSKSLHYYQDILLYNVQWFLSIA